MEAVRELDESKFGQLLANFDKASGAGRRAQALACSTRCVPLGRTAVLVKSPTSSGCGHARLRAKWTAA